MKVGIRVHLFNWRMRQRRAEMEFSQKELAELTRLNINDIGFAERLLDIPGDIGRVNDKLARIANALEMDFDVLFPQDYLAMLQAKKLPRYRSPYLWCREVAFEELTDSAEIAQLPSPQETVELQELCLTLRKEIEELPDREQQVLQLRYGLNGKEKMTLEEIGNFLGITRGRIRQIEAQALSRLRHPVHSKKLRVWLHD